MCQLRGVSIFSKGNLGRKSIITDSTISPLGSDLQSCPALKLPHAFPEFLHFASHLQKAPSSYTATQMYPERLHQACERFVLVIDSSLQFLHPWDNLWDVTLEHWPGQILFTYKRVYILRNIDLLQIIFFCFKQAATPEGGERERETGQQNPSPVPMKSIRTEKYCFERLVKWTQNLMANIV